MNNTENDYDALPFPRSRHLVLDAGWTARRKHMIHGLVEVDVTHPRELIRTHEKRTGEKLSFTAFIVACLGRALDDDLELHAYRNWRNQLIVFDDVDVAITIETEIEGRKFPMLHIIRSANRRTCYDIHKEIRAIQSEPTRSPEMGFVKLFPWLPAFMRRALYSITRRSPHLQKRYAGTVGLTSVGMFGSRGAWGLGVSAHTLAVTIGSISGKQGIVDDQIAIREYLFVTLSFDHSIIDGAPAARFTERFAELIEQGYGLDNLG